MTIISFQITTYRVLLGSKIGIGFPSLNYCYALITCTGAAGEQLLLAFGDVPVQGQSNFSNLGQKRGGVAVSMSQFGSYLDILRNEKPVYGQICDTNPDTLNLVKTTEEPVGEGE